MSNDTKDLGNYDAQRELTRTILNNDELMSLVDGGLHNRVARQDAPFPRLVYTRLNNIPTAYADGEEVKATVNFQISVFTDSSTVNRETEIVKKVDRIMKNLNYRKYDEQPLYETDTKLYHVALRYEKNFYGGNE